YFLLVLVEQGVPGLLFFLLLLGVAFYTAQQTYHTTNDVFWKAAIATVAVILVMICTVNFLSDLIETDKVGPLFYLCLAVLALAKQKSNKANSELPPHIQGVA
ncbi:MAG TPA: hypothetical protein VM010_01220, partial [Chitinophagaceae bacterium]|nr:hypothetical protein [Chitinophagaceae bacterium]